MKLAKWAFLGVATIAYLLGTIGLSIVWLDDPRDVPLGLDVFSVTFNAFSLATGIASVVLAGVFIYAFRVKPKAQRQAYIVSTIPIAIGIGLILATPVPVKASSACGNKHSIAPVVTAPVFLNDPYKRASLLTYDYDESDRYWCDGATGEE